MAKVGFSQVDITPPIGTTLAGYKYERVSVGVHDNLYARTLIVDFKGELFCLIQMDVIGVDEYFTKKIFDEVKDLGIKESNLIVVATHTHSGPKGIFDERNILDEENFGVYNDSLVTEYINKLEKCVRTAYKNRNILDRVEISSSYVHGICSERHDNTKGDGRLFIIKFIDKKGKNLMLYNYSCHPTILHHDNLEISADLPYGVLKHLEDYYDGIIFTNGSAGDISTRFTRKETTFEEVERLGRELGTAIENTVKNPIYIGDIKDFKLERYKFPLKFREIHSIEEAKKAYEDAAKAVEKAKREGMSPSELRLVESRFEGAWRDLKFTETLGKRDDLVLQINIFKINDWNFITIPGEIFSSLTKPLRDLGNNIILGYTNGYYLYIADKEAFDKDYYEASSSYIRKGEGEKLISLIIEMLEEDFA